MWYYIGSQTSILNNENEQEENEKQMNKEEEEEYTKINVYTVQYVVSYVHRKRSPTEEQSFTLGK